MPRLPQFKIKKFSQNHSSFWGIYVPAWLNPSQKRGYLFFSTKAEAEAKRGALLASTRSESKILELSNAQVRDAQRAFERLAEAHVDCSLDRAVELALPLLRSSGSHRTFEELFRLFADLKAPVWAPHSLANFRFVSRHFLKRFAGRTVASLSSSELAAWLADAFPSPSSQAFAVRTLRPAFSYALRQDWIAFSPFSRLEPLRVRPRDAVDVFSPDEARRLLLAAPYDCRPAFALLLFAGVRPAELTRLVWGDVKEGFLHIRPSVAKRPQVRNVELEDNLLSFLVERGAPDEPIVPPNWKRKSQEARRAAGLSHRPDAARHSYATFFLAKYKDVDALKANLGHARNSHTLFAFYRAAAVPAEAEAFWAITAESLTEDDAPSAFS